MRSISKLVSSMGARGWFVIGLCVLGVGVLGILENGPSVVPCLAAGFAGLAFRCSIVVHKQARVEPARPWLKVERPTERK